MKKEVIKDEKKDKFRYIVCVPNFSMLRYHWSGKPIILPQKGHISYDLKFGEVLEVNKVENQNLIKSTALKDGHVVLESIFEVSVFDLENPNSLLNNHIEELIRCKDLGKIEKFLRRIDSEITLIRLSRFGEKESKDNLYADRISKIAKEKIEEMNQRRKNAFVPPLPNLLNKEQRDTIDKLVKQVENLQRKVEGK